MEKRFFILLLLIYYNISFGQSPFEPKDSCATFSYFMKSNEELLKYIDNPCPDDSSCKKDILKAMAEVKKGQIKFLMPMSLGTFELRQEHQLRQLCDSNGLIFDYELFSCVASGGQTNGCYGLYMDKIIAQKFGKGFKENLLSKADSMYVGTNPTVYFTNCDSLPRLLENLEIATDIWMTIGKELLNKLKKCSYGDYPQIDIGFYIDTVGNPSNYFVSQYNICEKSDYKFKNELSKLAIDYLKARGKWIPGTILNRKVRTEFNTRVHFN